MRHELEAKEKEAFERLVLMKKLPFDSDFDPRRAGDGEYSLHLKVALSDPALDRVGPNNGQERAGSIRKVRQPNGSIPSAYAQQDSSNGDGKPEDVPRKQTSAGRLAELDAAADILRADPTIRRSDRLIRLRHEAHRLDLNLRDDELRRKIWEAQRRQSGAVEVVRKGERLNLAPVPWLWEGLLQAGTSNLILALPKVGKTSLLIAAIAAWHRGATSFLGQPFYGFCPPVLIAGTDMPEGDWARLLHRFGLAHADGTLLPDGPIEALFHQGAPIHLDDEGIEKLADLSAKFPGALVINDSYAKLVGPLNLKEGLPEFAGPLGDLQEALAPFKATLVVIHHSGHSRKGEGAVAASRGGTALPAAVSHVVALDWLNRNKGKADRRIVLETQGRAGEPLQLLIEQADDCWILHGDAAATFQQQAMEEAEEGLNDRHGEALDFVRERWEQGRQRTTAVDLKPIINANPNSAERIARRVLKRLEHKGFLISTKETVPTGHALWFWPIEAETVSQTDRVTPLSDMTHLSEVSAPSEPPTNQISYVREDRTLRSDRIERTGGAS